jgi:hypothetical protein
VKNMTAPIFIPVLPLPSRSVSKQTAAASRGRL